LPHSEDIGHILGIVSSLLTNLASDSTHRIRLLAKFVDGDYEKVDKLLEIRDGARKRLRDTEKELEQEKQVSLITILVIFEFYSCTML
jgi:beta-catenin-like protein 1